MVSVKSYAWRWVWIGLILLMVSAVVLAGGNLIPNGVGTPTTREFNIKAFQYAYEPGVIKVNKGDRVILHVSSVDVSHGLYLDGYGQQVNVLPGEEGTIEFVADRVGKYRFRCAETCGPMHPFMVGEMVVQPNDPFTGSVALTALTAIGAVGYAWRRKDSSDG